MDPARLERKLRASRAEGGAAELPFSTNFDDMVEFYRLMSPADLQRAAEGAAQNERWFGRLELGHAGDRGKPGSWISYQKISDAIAVARGLPKRNLAPGNQPFPSTYEAALAGYERYLRWESFMPTPLRSVRADLAKLNEAFSNRLYIRQDQGSPIAVRTLIEAMDAATGR
jgi:hypothetical protein